MDILKRDTRDIVLSIMDQENESIRKIKCNLLGVNYDFCRKYMRYARFEKEYFSHARYTIYAVRIPKIKKDGKYSKLRIYCLDNIAEEIDDWNMSFNSIDFTKRKSYRKSYTIPFRFISEWTLKMLHEFDLDRNHMLLHDGPVDDGCEQNLLNILKNI